MSIPAQRSRTRSFHNVSDLVDFLWPTTVTPKKGIVPHTQGCFVSTAFVLGNVTTAQNAFPATADLMTVAAATLYRFRGLLYLTTGATSHTTGFGLTLGTTTLASIKYRSIAHSAADDTLAAAQVGHWEVATASVVAAASTAVETLIDVEGTFRTVLGGTIAPFIIFSADPTGTCQTDVGSFFEYWPVGASTVIGVGNVA